MPKITITIRAVPPPSVPPPYYHTLACSKLYSHHYHRSSGTHYHSTSRPPLELKSNLTNISYAWLVIVLARASP